MPTRNYMPHRSALCLFIFAGSVGTPFLHNGPFLIALLHSKLTERFLPAALPMHKLLLIQIKISIICIRFCILYLI